MARARYDIHAPAAVDADTFRWALARHATGVAVITADAGYGPAGLTATSVVSVSLEPPMVAFSVDSASSTWPKMRDATSIVVHLLGQDQHDLASRFATKGIDRFAPPTEWEPRPTGEPLLKHTPAWIRLELIHQISLGDHHLVVGNVVEAQGTREARPLIYHQRRYRACAPFDTRRSPTARGAT